MKTTYRKNEAKKFLERIKKDGQICQYEYKKDCFLMWIDGLISKMENGNQFVYINKEQGWVNVGPVTRSYDD